MKTAFARSFRNELNAYACPPAAAAEALLDAAAGLQRRTNHQCPARNLPTALGGRVRGLVRACKALKSGVGRAVL